MVDSCSTSSHSAAPQDGDVEIECLNLDTSPTLRVDASLEQRDMTLETEVYPSRAATTRNETQVSGAGFPSSDPWNQVMIASFLLDENDDPINHGTAAGEVHNVEIRFTGGPTEGARFEGCATGGTAYDPGTGACTGGVVTATTVFMAPTVDAGGAVIPGLFWAKGIAGVSEGTLDYEIRDRTSLSQPSVRGSFSVQDPDLNCYTSSEEVGEDRNASILCSLTSVGGTPIANETIQCKVQGGDSRVDVTPGDDDPVALNINMAELNGSGDLTANNGLGWYYCDMESETNIPNDDTTTLRITNLDRSQLDTETMTINTSNDTPSSAPTDLQVIPIETNIGPGVETSILIIAQETDRFGIQGLGVACPDAAGCVEIDAGTLTNMTESDAVEELGAASTGTGNGAGAYFANVTSALVDDRGEVEVLLRNSISELVEDIEVNFNIRDHEVTAYSTRDDLVVDEATGIYMVVEDENGDLVHTLAPGDWTITNLGVATTNTAVGEILPTNVNVIGGGVYAFSADTLFSTVPGSDVELRAALTGFPTTPQDTVSVGVDDVELVLRAIPDFVQATNCVLITAQIQDPDGDPIDVVTPATNGVRLRILGGNSDVGLLDGDETAANCAAGGGTHDLPMTLNVGTTAEANGMYVATLHAGVSTDTIIIEGTVEGANSFASERVTVDVD